MMLVALCTGIGLLCAVPATAALFTSRTTMGQPLEVFVVPVDAEQAQLAVLYEFATPNGNWLAWTQGNGWWRAGADPVLPRAEAEQRATRLRQEFDSPRRTSYRVHYRANDPGGSAFILLEDGVASWGQKIGIVLVAFSLLLSLPLPVWGERKPEHRRKSRP